MQKNMKKFRKVLQQVYRIENFDKFIDKIKKLEEKNIYIQPIPCDYIMDTELIEIAAKLAIKDFELGINKAKKISTEFLLRFTGRSQIREAIEEFFQPNQQTFMIVVFSDTEELNMETLINELKQHGEPEEGCKKNLNAICDKFNILEEEIRAVKRPGESKEDAVKKILLERIALSIFM
ncbi:MAG: KEOPS complex subunit Cgi121 [Candidatus Njordarchaeia archaeon]